MKKKILVIKLGHLGDVVRAMSLIKGIKQKYPESEIHWVTRNNAIPLFENHPEIDKVFTIPCKLGEDYDILYSIDIEKEGLDLANEVKAKEKYGFYSEGGYPAAYNFPAEYYLSTFFDDQVKKENRKTYQQMIFEATELDYDKQKPFLNLNPGDLEYAEDYFKSKEIPSDNLIGVSFGAAPTNPSKVWHTPFAEQFIEKVLEKGFNVMLLGGPNELEKLVPLQKRFLDKGFSNIFINDPKNTVRQFAAVVKKLSYFVGADSFPMHIALTMGIPSLVLFFTHSPHEIEGYDILEKVESPLRLQYYPEKLDEYIPELVKSISVEEVLEGFTKIVSKFNSPVLVKNAIIRNSDGKFLVIKRKEGIHKGKWAFPGGILEEGEDFVQTITREIREETGLKVKEVLEKIADYIYKRPSGKKTHGESYYVEVEDYNVSPNEEVEDFKWIAPEELEEIDHISGLDEEIMKVLSLKGD